MSEWVEVARSPKSNRNVDQKYGTDRTIKTTNKYKALEDDDTNATIAGGSTTGTVDAGQSFGLVVVPPDVDSVTLHIRTGWTGADLSWSIDDGA